MQVVKRPLISQDFKEFAIVGAVLTGILLPARFLFVELVGDSILGSLGVISAISITIIVLAQKNKLGKFGEMFQRQMIRLTTGRRRFFVVALMSMLILYMSFSIYTIELGNTVYLEQKLAIQEKVFAEYDFDFENPEEVLETINPEDVTAGLPDYFSAIVNDMEAIAITNAIVNDYSNGMILSLHTVLLVEEIELIGLFIFFTILVRRNPEKLKLLQQNQYKVIEKKPKPKKNRFRLKLLFLFMAIFSVAYQIGSMFEVPEQEAQALMEQITILTQGIDGIGIFFHNSTVALIMFLPAFGMFWGTLTGFQTGYAFSALSSLTPMLDGFPALALLYLSPIGLMELFAYSIAMSRSFILIKDLRKKQFHWKPLGIEVGIVLGLLLIGGIIEIELIKWASEMGIDMFGGIF